MEKDEDGQGGGQAHRRTTGLQARVLKMHRYTESKILSVTGEYP